MTFVIGSACVDIVDKSCVQECPADCIYEGDRAMYINPNECVVGFLDNNTAYFSLTLSGRDEPLGDPGGADKLGRVGADTPLAALPRSTTPHP